MKQIVHTILFSAFAMSLNAQITLTQANALDAADRYITGANYTSLAPNIVPGNSGPAQTWNLITATHEYFDTMNVSALGWIPAQYSTPYPQSNLALHYGSYMMSFDILTSNTNGIYVDGSTYLDPQFGVQNMPYQDPLEFMTWPLTYGNLSTDTAFSDWTFPTTGQTDSARQIVTMYITTEADGWGTLNTSYGTFSTIRVKRAMNYYVQFATHDSVSGWGGFSFYTFDSKVYEWWTDTPGIGMPVVSIYVDPVMDTVTQYGIMTTYTVGIPAAENSLQNISVYPNPATDHISLTGEENSKWEIVDLSGKVVKHGILTSDCAEISIAGLSSGIYLMSVIDESGVKRIQKFVVGN